MDIIINYFNKTLKDKLKYPETFSLTQDNKIILTPNQESQLLRSIKSNTELKEMLLMELTYQFKKLNPNLIDLYLSTHGNDIVINLKSSKELVYIPKELFTLIFSYLDAENLNNVREIYEYDYVFDSTFWMTLVTLIFEEYIILGVPIELSKYRDFYYGLSLISPYAYTGLLEIVNKYPVVMKYLLRNKQLKLNANTMKELIYALDDVDIFKIYFDELYHSDRRIDVYQNGVITRFLPVDPGYTKVIFENLYKDIIYYTYKIEIKLVKPNIYNYIREMSGVILNLFESIKFLYYLHVKGNNILFDYLWKNLPSGNAEEVSMSLIYIIDYKTLDIQHIRELWEKYKHLYYNWQFTEFAKLSEYSNKFEGKEKTELIDIFK
jgi:hypothetical protein